MGKTHLGIPGLAFTSAAGSGRISPSFPLPCRAQTFFTPAGAKFELLPLSCVWIFIPIDLIFFSLYACKEAHAHNKHVCVFLYVCVCV